VAFSPDGALLAVGKSNGMVGIWDLPTGEPIKHFLHDLTGGPVAAVAFSPDGWLLASAGRDGQLKLRDLRTGRLILRRPHPGPLQAVAFDPSADLVATACADGVLRVWTRGGRLESERIEACTSATRAIVFTSGGPVAASEAEPQTRYSAEVAADGSLRVRVLQTG
jgi:WD40 repeat protein